MSRHALIRGALEALSLTQASRWLPAAGDASGFVITLHHIVPQSRADFAPNALLSITPEFLDRLLGHLHDRGWRFVSLEELVAPPDGQAADPRRIAVTLDDGYRDNAEHALPVFKRHDVPFTIFVTPGFCDRTSELWWEALERIIAGVDSVALNGEGPADTLPTATLAEKLAAYHAWTEWLTQEADETRQRFAIRALCAKYELDLAALARDLVMDWDEVRAIAAEPLCTIGAHTMTHPALARLEPDAAMAEMRESADRIATEIGTRPATIAFPYGHPNAAGAREAELAAAAGFVASFTTQPGFVSDRGTRQSLPRVSVNGLFQELRYLDVLLAPGLWTLRNRIRRTG